MKRIEKHLYQSDYETVRGEWSRRYFAIFTPWNQTKSKTFALGDDLDLARSKLKRIRELNAARVEVILDEQREKREALAEQAEAERQKAKGITFAQFGEQYLSGQIPVPLVRGKRPKRQRTLDGEKENFNSLVPYFGDVPLSEITKARILAFAAQRVKVPVTTGRKAGDNSLRSIANELKFLRYLLNRAVDNEVIMVAPKIKIPKGGRRTGSIREQDYRVLLSHLQPDQRRYAIALWETGWRLNEPRRLNWHKTDRDGRPLVDLKKGVLRLNADDVKEDYPRVTPISPELRRVLLELKHGVASIDGAVFVRKNGKPIRSIREAFLVAREKAGIPNAIIHDIRRSTIRRWEAMGISRQAVMQAVGHRPDGVHEVSYAELNEDQLIEAFTPLIAIETTAEKKKQAAAGGQS